MNVKYSILNPSEQQYIQSRLITRRKQQLEHLAEDLALHEFLLLESTSSRIVAWESGGGSVTWSAESGFAVSLTDTFYLDAVQVAACFRAVRKEFFENFCQGGVEPQAQQVWITAEVTPSSKGALPVVSPEAEPDLAVQPVASNTGDEETDFLSEGLKSSEVFSGGEEIPVEAEPQEISSGTEAEEPAEMALESEPESEPEAMMSDDGDDSMDLLSRMENLGSMQIEVGDHSEADEFSNLSTDEDAPVVVEEVEPEPVAEEPVDEIELLKAEMLASGMDEGKANKLIVAVKSGKATAEAVRQTLKKLAGG